MLTDFKLVSTALGILGAATEVFIPPETLVFHFIYLSTRPPPPNQKQKKKEHTLTHSAAK